MKATLRSGRTSLSLSLSLVVSLLLSWAAEAQLPGLSEAGPHHRVARTLGKILDGEGRVAWVTNRYVELAVGLNAWDAERKEWVSAVAEFTRTADGHCVATRTQTKVILPADLALEPVDALGPDGTRLTSVPRGLALVDTRNAESVLVAELQSSPAELVSPTQVVYRGAFRGKGVEADVVFDLGLGFLEQSVVLRTPLPRPETVSRSDGQALETASTRVAVITEFLGAPEPARQTRALKTEADLQRRAQLALPDLADEELRFGTDLTMFCGRAFSLDRPELPVPTGKEFLKSGDRAFLTESCDFADLARALEALPGQAEGTGEAKKYRTAQAGVKDLLPTVESYAASREVAFADRLKLYPTAAARETDPERGRELRLAMSRPGVVLDYNLQGSFTTLTLLPGADYYVVDNVTVSSTFTLSGGAVVKYAPGKSIVCSGPVVCDTGPYSQCVFTGRDDNTVGVIVDGSTGDPTAMYYANPALQIRSHGQTLHDLRVSHAEKGIFFYDFSAGLPTNTVKHVQLVRCGTAVQANGYGTTFQHLRLHNVLIYNAGTAVYGYSFDVQAQHLTVDHCAELAHDYSGGQYGTSSTLGLVNSLLAVVTNVGNVTCTQTHCEWPASDSVFDKVGAGLHYLPADSPYKQAAPVELIDAGLATDLGYKTTDAPLVIADSLSFSLTLRPRAHRGYVWWSEGGYDLGFHYDPIDYALGTLVVTSPGGNPTVLSLVPGVAVATFADHGIRLDDYSQLVAEGNPMNPVRLFRFNAVQEQSYNWGNGIYEPCAVVGPAHARTAGSDPPLAALRFANFTGLGGRGYHLYSDVNWFLLRAVCLRECELRAGKALMSGQDGIYATTLVGLTNNLFYAGETAFKGAPAVSAFNNLFHLGSASLTRWWGAWEFKDNVFHEVSLTDSGGVSNGYNGYVPSTNAHLLNSSGGDVTLAAFVYTNGPLGDHYHSTTNFQNAGDRSGGAASLYWFTTDPASQSRETNSLVDLGYHHVAAQTNSAGVWCPIDADPGGDNIPVGDGVWDYAEDRNGNGTYESAGGETSPGSMDTDSDALNDSSELAYGTNPNGQDTDGDNPAGEFKWKDGYEIWLGSNPTDPLSVTPQRLGYWRFNNGSSWTNEAGIGPSAAQNLSAADSFEGTAVCLTNAGALLRYPCSQNPTNYVNDPVRYLDPRHGGVRFWYLPAWYHGSPTDTPGAACTLLQCGSWRLYVTADGRSLIFESPTASGATNQNLRVMLPRSGETPFQGVKGWEITLNYSRASSWILIDNGPTTDPYGDLAVNGLGVEALPDSASLAAGFHVGCSPGVVAPAKGSIDELETFNASVGVGPAGGFQMTPFARMWDNWERRCAVLTASAPAGQDRIDLNWVRGFEGDPVLATNNYRLERRELGATSWTTLQTGLATDHATDATASPGTVYEYRVYRQDTNQAPTTVAALRASPVHSRGKALVLVDTNVAPDIAAELAQFREDLRQDGWIVPENDTVMPRHVEDFQGAYAADLNRVKSRIMGETDLNVVVLVGHITIPYSGDGCAEDGHGDHSGAWPADLWYGDRDGVWRDTNVNNGLTNSFLRNVPGDSKWDEGSFPPSTNGVTALEIAVGRIDFAKLDAFVGCTNLPGPPPASVDQAERLLLKLYFQKARNWRNKQLVATDGDTWRLFVQKGVFLHLVRQARSIATHFVGATTLQGTALDDVFAPTADYGGHRYLWGVHGAYGDFYRISNVDTSVGRWRTADGLRDLSLEPQVIFYALMGSYFADWSIATNDFMRACLGTTNCGLAAIWAGNRTTDSIGPHPKGLWKLDRLALGYHLGAALQDTIPAAPSQSSRALFILGDPTLRAYATAPPTGLSGSTNGNPVTLTWSAAGETVDGYYVYRGTSLENALQQGPRNSTPTTNLTFTEAGVPSGTNTYAVRAVKLIRTGAGSFNDLSPAVTTTVIVQ